MRLRNINLSQNQAKPTKPCGLCFDIGNVLIFPDGEMLADLLEQLLSRSFDPSDCRNSFIMADQLIYQHNNPTGLEANLTFKEAWTGYLGISESESYVWDVVMKANRKDVHYWSWVDPQAGSTLQYFSGLGIKLGAVSNTDGHLESDLKEFGLYDDFTICLDSQKIGIEKPDPHIFRLCAENLGLSPELCWYIGDTATELPGAKQAGIGTVVLYDPLMIYDDSSDYIRVSSLEQLRVLVKEVYHD